MNRLIIVGASGHGKVIADIAVQNGYKDIVFLDDNINLKKCSNYEVIGKTDLVNNLEGDKIVAIGNSVIRERILSKISAVTLIHPNAVIAKDAIIGKGTVIMAGVVINPNVKIGDGCIINTSSSIDHDCFVSDFSHVSVGSHLCGNVTVGSHVWVGAGSIVSNNISICDNCTLGAGAVVIKDIDKCGTYVGVPARIIKEN